MEDVFEFFGKKILSISVCMQDCFFLCDEEVQASRSHCAGELATVKVQAAGPRPSCWGENCQPHSGVGS